MSLNITYIAGLLLEYVIVAVVYKTPGHQFIHSITYPTTSSRALDSSYTHHVEYIPHEWHHSHACVDCHICELQQRIHARRPNFSTHNKTDRSCMDLRTIQILHYAHIMNELAKLCANGKHTTEHAAQLIYLEPLHPPF
jgi:hypothetical protein